MKYPDPIFPPLLSATAVEGSQEPFWQAVKLAARAKKGAGDVLWSRSKQRADLAIILEPDVPLTQAQQMAPVSMLAMGDALGVLCPPQVSVHFQWPGDILINGARAGSVTLAAQSCDPADVPHWLVIGMNLQIMHDDSSREPGEVLDRTCLVEEGIGENLTRSDIVKTIASYWMAGLNNWLDEGLRGCHDRGLLRAAGREEPISIRHNGQTYTGTVLGLDEEAGLLLRQEKPATTHSLSYAPFIHHLEHRHNE